MKFQFAQGVNVALGVNVDWFHIFFHQEATLRLSIFCDFEILWLNFQFAAQVSVKVFLDRCITICHCRATGYRNLTIFCFLTTKDKNLTHCTRTNCWLTSEVFITNNSEPFCQMSLWNKSQPLFPVRTIAKEVIYRTKEENQ